MGRSLYLEELELRLAPTANIIYNPVGGSNLTLRVVQLGGVANLELVDDNAAKSVIQDVVLNQDCLVQITGDGDAADVLTVDFSFTGTATSEPITVNFDGGTPTTPPGPADQVNVVGSGAVYQPASFKLDAKSTSISVSGGLSAVGDISLTSTTSVTLAGDGHHARRERHGQ